MDIESNRSAKKWTRKELVGRVLWALCSPLFRFSPRLFWGWRCFLLRLFGAKVGSHVQVHPSVRIFIPWNLEISNWSSIGFGALIYNLGTVKIGEKVTISQRVHLCAGTHDYKDPTMPLLKPPLTIEDKVWICADAFVGPDVCVGKRAIVAAASVVVKTVSEREVVGGNPAKFIKHR